MMDEKDRFRGRANDLCKRLVQEGVACVGISRERIDFTDDVSADLRTRANSILQSWDWNADPDPESPEFSVQPQGDTLVANTKGGRIDLADIVVWLIQRAQSGMLTQDEWTTAKAAIALSISQKQAKINPAASLSNVPDNLPTGLTGLLLANLISQMNSTNGRVNAIGARLNEVMEHLREQGLQAR